MCRFGCFRFSKYLNDLSLLVELEGEDGRDAVR